MHNSVIPLGGDDKDYKLAKKHRYAILAHMFRAKHIKLEDKMKVLEEVLGDDKTDQAVNTRAKCMVCLPTAEAKAKAWAEITDPDSQESVYLRQAKISGLYSWDQLDLI